MTYKLKQLSASMDFQVTASFWKIQFSIVEIKKPKKTNLTLPLKRSRSTEGNHMNKL